MPCFFIITINIFGWASKFLWFPPKDLILQGWITRPRRALHQLSWVLSEYTYRSVLSGVACAVLVVLGAWGFRSLGVGSLCTPPCVPSPIYRSGKFNMNLSWFNVVQVNVFWENFPTGNLEHKRKYLLSGCHGSRYSGQNATDHRALISWRKSWQTRTIIQHLGTWPGIIHADCCVRSFVNPFHRYHEGRV